MRKTSSPALSESGRLHGGIAPLAVVIATNLVSAHSTGQYLAGLAALALALAHDTLTHRLLRPAAAESTAMAAKTRAVSNWDEARIMV